MVNLKDQKGGAAIFWLIVIGIAIWLFFFATSGIVVAHPGRTDSVGCHTCRTNCPNWGLSTGEYHCHNAKASPQPEEPIKSTFGENGTGYTQPAPEYKAPKTITPTLTEEKPAATTEVKKGGTKVEAPVMEAPAHRVGFWKRFFGWLFGS